MGEWRDYYQILGVDYKASDEEIKDAYRYKCQTIHPDKVRNLAEKHRQRANEELKWINEAYDVLKDSDKKRRYDFECLQRHAQPSASQQIPKPKPVATPHNIVFSNAVPGKVKTSSFILENHGGPYSAIEYSEPDSWIKIIGPRSVNPSSELPLQFEIEAAGEEWGKDYVQYISISLDDQEVQVKVELHTIAKPAPPPPPFVHTTPPTSATVTQPVSSRVGSILLGIIVGLVIGGGIAYATIFHTGGLSTTIGRILGGIGVTGILGTGISLLIKDKDFLWILAGIGMAIAAGVFYGELVNDFSANLVALSVLTVSSGVTGGFAGYITTESTVFFQTTVRKPSKGVLRKRKVWVKWLPVFAVAVTSVVLILGDFPIPPSLPRSVYLEASQKPEYLISWSVDRRKIALMPINFHTHSGISIVGIDGSDPNRISLNFAGGYDITGAAWSPDGQRIAFTKRSYKNAAQSDLFEWTDSFGEIYVLGITGDTSLHFLSAGYDPAWSPDGRRIAFIGNPPGGSDLRIVSDDGSRLHRYELFPIQSPSLSDPSWSPDGQMIAVVVSNYDRSKVSPRVGGAGDIWTADVSEPSTGYFVQKIAEGDYYSPQWSPDGQQIAFLDWNGIYIVSRYGNNFRKLAHTDGRETGLAWSVDGEEILFYMQGRGLYAMKAEGGKPYLICRSR